MLQDVLRDLVALIPAPGSLGSGGPQDAGRGATDRWRPQSRREGLGLLDQIRAGCGWQKKFPVGRPLSRPSHPFRDQNEVVMPSQRRRPSSTVLNSLERISLSKAL